jgi:uncharacterized YkwD family protein
MKKFSVKLAAALVLVLIFSTMVVGASAASVTNSGTSCGNGINDCTNSTCADTQTSQCLYGLELASRLGILNLSRCANGTCFSQSNSTCANRSCTTGSSDCSTGTCTSNGSSGTTGSSDSTAVNGAGTTCTGTKSFSKSLSDILTKYGFNFEKYCGTGTGNTQEAETSSSEDDGTAVVTPSPSVGNEASDDSTAAEDTSNDTEEASDDTSIDNLSFEQQVVALVNEQRAANGLAPLTLSQSLSDVARAKSQDMHDNNYFSHTSPTYGSPFDMLSAFGISYRTAGENIAMGYSTPEAVMNGWMNSAGHRANILNANYTQIGVGYVADGNYWTQEFIG